MKVEGPASAAQLGCWKPPKKTDFETFRTLQPQKGIGFPAEHMWVKKNLLRVTIFFRQFHGQNCFPPTSPPKGNKYPTKAIVRCSFVGLTAVPKGSSWVWLLVCWSLIAKPVIVAFYSLGMLWFSKLYLSSSFYLNHLELPTDLFSSDPAPGAFGPPPHLDFGLLWPNSWQMQKPIRSTQVFKVGAELQLLLFCKKSHMVPKFNAGLSVGIEPSATAFGEVRSMPLYMRWTSAPGAFPNMPGYPNLPPSHGGTLQTDSLFEMARIHLLIQPWDLPQGWEPDCAVNLWSTSLVKKFKGPLHPR